MIDQIKEALVSWDYDKALALFEATGSNPSLVRILSSGETTFFRKKLRHELQSLLHDTQLTKSREESPLKGGARRAGGVSVGRGGYEPELLPTITRRNLAIRRQDYLRGQLQLLKKAPAKKVYPICREIIHLDDELNECWKIIHYFREHGSLPADEVQSVIDQAKTWLDLFKIYSNVKSNISRAKSGKIPVDKLTFYQTLQSRIEFLLNSPLTRGDVEARDRGVLNTVVDNQDNHG